MKGSRMLGLMSKKMHETRAKNPRLMMTISWALNEGMNH